MNQRSHTLSSTQVLNLYGAAEPYHGLFDSGKLITVPGTVLPLEDAHVAHEMLGGAPHKGGKIVLSIAAYH
ncbi:MAG TPA: hypothetical protein VKJ45_04590 [Blastocatellia bacterium]|nr:hypothetical protein [Blastocatellia bacterium]